MYKLKKLKKELSDLPKWLKVISVFTLLILIFSTSIKLVGYIDRQRFEEAEKSTQKIATEIENQLGDNLEVVNTRNQCFKTGQGPYDDGSLWCQTATIIELKNNVSFTDYGRLFVDSAKNINYESFSSSNFGENRYGYVVDGRLSCTLSYINDMGETFGSSTKRVLYDSAAPALAITCSDRANARHY